MEQEAANDELVRALLSAWERRDTGFILDHFADDAVYHAMPLRPIVGKAALTPWVESFEDVPAGRLEILHQVATGDLVMNERVDRITIEGTEVTLAICAVFEVGDGRIRAWREYFDLAGLQAALRDGDASARPA
jgi:limonene-1,2-epoxide hydrolase